jgi:CheY-like chemotaxis protein
MALTGKRVLVVEDEALAAMLLEDNLESLGCTVVGTAARLEAAEQQARSAAIDVATLDVNLAGQMSYPVAAILRSRDIPFLFATGYSGNSLPVELRDAVVLTKPYSRDALASALKRSLAENAGPAPQKPDSAPAADPTKSP